MKKGRGDNQARKSTKILASCVVFILIFLLTWINPFVSADNFLSDSLYQHDSSPSLPITIVKIDDRTISELGQYTEWDRSVFAELVDKLSDAELHPSVIAFDIVFSGYKDADDDEAFVSSVAASPARVVVGSYLVFDERMITDARGGRSIDTSYVSEASLPYPELAAVSYNGFTNSQMDSHDGYMRSCMTVLTSDDVTYTSFPLTILEAYAEATGDHSVAYPVENDRTYRFTYTGSPGTFDTVSMAEILDGTYPLSNLAGGIVLVGAYTSGFGEECYTPAARDDVMYGVEVNANIIDALYNGSLQDEGDTLLVGLVYGSLAAIAVFVMLTFNPIIDAIVVLALLAVQYIVSGQLYDSGIYIVLFPFTLGLPLSYFAMIIYHYVSERAKKQQISKAFKLYVAPQIVDEVTSRGDYQLELGGRTKDIAVLFVDIRGFTSMSENLQPEEVVGILNEYFEIITNAVFKNNGTIDKFIGDAAMAVFNSPFDLDDYVFRAVCTAWDIAEGSQKLSPILLEKFGRTVSYGIGVNCGPAVIGNMGSKFRMDYTAIGDTVNTSSRLESNAKAGQILISQEVRDRLGDRIEVEEIGVIPLKGKKVGINVFNVTGIHR